MSRTAFFSARAIPAVAILAIALDITAEEEAPPQFIVTFTEDKNGFYINGEKFTRDAFPMPRAKVGSFQHWRIVNATRELHPMLSIKSISWRTPKTANPSPTRYG